MSTRCLLISGIVACGLLLSAASAAAADVKASGLITLNGKPLRSGKVTFYLENDQFVGSKVKEGKYAVDRLPLGVHKVTIEGEGVPAQYVSEETSGIVVEARKGDNSFSFDLVR